VSQACFENPVLHDVLVRGRKVAGAAQRRTRAGLMHQGSIQPLKLPPGFGAAFAARLGGVVRLQSFDATIEAEKLVAEKYGTRAWMERRR
jgi:lipoate-protein ligase A